MNEQFITGATARWEVIWWSRKGKRFIVKDFQTDLHGALSLYTRVKAARAPFATLRCCNVGFPPPVAYRPHTKTFVKKEKVKRKGKIRIRRIKVQREITPMDEVNLRGIWWCPYCREMRRFRMQEGAMYRDGKYEYFIRGKGMYCPVCEISHIDSHVRRWNPEAQRLPFKLKQTRRSSRSARSKRRRTRSR